MTDFTVHKPTLGGTDYPTKIDALIDAVDDEFADSNWSSTGNIVEVTDGTNSKILKLRNDNGGILFKMVTTAATAQISQTDSDGSSNIKDFIVFNQNAGVDLYHNDTLKLSTTSSGITVEGSVILDEGGFSIANTGADNRSITNYNDTNGGFRFQNIGTSGDGRIQQLDIAGSPEDTWMYFNRDGGIDLYENNSVRLSTTTTGVTVTGDADVNGFVTCGNTGTQDLTIDTGELTITGSFHRVDTEASASTDDVDTITGGNTGSMLVLKTVASGRDVTLKDGTGNVRAPTGDITLSHADDMVMLVKYSTNWYVVSFSDNG